MADEVHIDFETYSEADLPTVGAFRYSEDPSTEAMIVSYSIGNGPVVGVNLTTGSSKEKRKLEPLFEAVRKGATVSAHNSQFERVIWENVCHPRQGWPKPPKPGKWDCTAARSAAMALPRSLEGSATALRLNVAKDPIGKSLIYKFSKPQPKTGVRIRPQDDVPAFNKFIEYCEQDTVVELTLDKVLPRLDPYELDVFELDYQINKRGIPVDIPLIHTALEFIDETTERLLKKSKKLTGLKPTQRDKMLEWLRGSGTAMATLQAAEVERVIAETSTSREIRDLLNARIEVSRAGTKKLKTMLACASADGRVRGSFWYNSASTGRWGSGGVQFHNLQKPDKKYPQEETIEWLELGGLDLMTDRPLSSIAKAVRGFLKAEEGRDFLIADYSAIEARGLAWIADEEFILEQYRAGRDIYKVMATRIFPGLRYEDVDESQRFLGKQAILGAGYNMSWARFIQQCAGFGVVISEKMAKRTIKAYRESVPNIVAFWSRAERAALKAILTGKPVSIQGGRLVFYMDKLSNGFEALFIKLPSGRLLVYPEARVENKEKWGKLLPTMVFKTYYRGMWVDEETYGGKLVENIVQALCRDLLADGMIATDRAGLPIILHVHDEIGAEVEQGQSSVAELEHLACQVRPWAKGLPIAAEGKRLFRYAK